MDKLKQWFIWAAVATLASQGMIANLGVTATAGQAYAAAQGSVVINEIAWAGTSDNSNDEWIELYNNSSQSVELTGWQIVDDGGASVYTIPEGVVAGHGYFLIEDAENAVANKNGVVVGLSLANSGDSLVLKDASGAVIDTVNGAGGAWYAGSNTSKASMERKDPGKTLDSADNWASALNGNGSVGSGGGEILGTPAGANSNYSGGIRVAVDSEETAFAKNEIIDLSVVVEDVEELFAYGAEVNYDPAALEFQGATDGNFLDGETAFNYALENGDAGTVIIANVRLNTEDGVSGSGDLFSLKFKVVGTSGNSAISFGGGSFLADILGDLPANFQSFNFTIGATPGSVGAVGGLKVEEGDQRYSLELNWTAPASGADSYIVTRKNAAGDAETIGTTTFLSFIDDENLIPENAYEYQVIAVKGGVLGAASNITGTDSRGLKGDIDRSDRVDGRDLEALAKAFGKSIGNEGYDVLADTSYDGIIDGDDLINLGVNFGLTF